MGGTPSHNPGLLRKHAHSCKLPSKLGSTDAPPEASQALASCGCCGIGARPWDRL